MLVTIEVDVPEQTVREYENAGIDWKARVQKSVQESLSTPAAAPKELDPKNAAAIALLQSWIREDATNDPEKLAEAEAEVAEFKRNLNAARAENGERVLFL